MRLHRSSPARPYTTSGLDEPPADCWPPSLWSPAAATARSCCCSAGPQVQVVLRPPAGGEPVEILLCGHHYRATRERTRAGAAGVYDLAGMPLVEAVTPS